MSHLALKTELDPRQRGYVRKIQQRLGQILINFCNNAVKFTERGEIVVTARVRESDEKGQLVHFDVRDTGIGLTQEQMGRLFQAFEQADASTTRQHGGTGLGLAISKRLAQLMGGDVGVTSQVGQGSTFWFTAYLGKGEGKARRVVTPDLRGRRVLVIDDNAQAREVLSSMLQGMTFKNAGHGWHRGWPPYSRAAQPVDAASPRHGDRLWARRSNEAGGGDIVRERPH
jgi:two-component system sensor histidine kinase/response regulator